MTDETDSVLPHQSMSQIADDLQSATNTSNLNKSRSSAQSQLRSITHRDYFIVENTEDSLAIAKELISQGKVKNKDKEEEEVNTFCIILIEG